ncbi:Tryptophan synthase beta subunit-like PLP-dependent enzymes superfamily [Phytophthora cinnamomi]|uniref:Tryptophan synthase beta subunit-like PLP-dependent enzymes superfamily n=1 Tax=Phytophthora cinnamomi TaxID=4785 RepID=UPI0035599673|nr:Tryptophan synthase beta subunit-like PLP-dependent enzymes superfamily [Phytophthora cinnamomi]
MARGWQWRASPVTRVRFRGQRVHVKRDDVFHLAGNKMRKMYWFVRQTDEFFACAHLFSFGGSQSNAMLALAQLADARRVPFTYFSRELQLRGGAVEGNLALARALGMDHVQLPPDAYHELVRTRDFAAFLDGDRRPPPGTKSLYVPQGAAFPEAQDGVKLLAEEINEYVRTEWPDKRFSVVLPCGTGTTALYLAQHLHPGIRLYAVPCVGDAAYLHQQFRQLIDEDPTLQEQTALLPRVIAPERKSRFGRLWWPLYDTYHEVLRETKVDFDLVYGAFAWHTLFSDDAVLGEVLGRSETRGALTRDLMAPSNKPIDGSGEERELLYVHTGGTSGNATMLARYERKNRGR